MNNGIALALALVCLMLLMVAFKWTLSQLSFLLALIAGLNQDSDNQWEAIHQLQQRSGPIMGGTHGDSLTAKKPSPEDKSHGENI